MKKKVWMKALGAITVAAVLMTGCGNTTDKNIDINVGSSVNQMGSYSLDEAGNVAIITPGANSYPIAASANDIQEIIYNSCYNYGSVYMINCDAHPKQYFEVDIPQPANTDLSERKKKDAAQRYAAMITPHLTEKKSFPAYPEVDSLDAIRIGSEILNAHKDNAQSYLVIADSGLGTVGYINFTQDLFHTPTDEIIQKLKAAKAIPDMTGIHVIWINAGVVSGNQDDLSELEKDKLKEIYTAIFVAGGAESVKFISTPVAEEWKIQLPYVTPVKTDARQIDIKPLETITLSADMVQFQPDKAVFVNEKQASKAIMPVVEALKNSPENSIYLIAGTASAFNDKERAFCKQLSQERGEAVKNVIVSNGIDPDRITVLGLGDQSPYHVNDVDENGKLIENKAKENRSVYIVDQLNYDGI